MIVIVSATQTFFACPNTYTGKTADGRTVLARYRWGHLSIRVQPAGVDDGADGAEGDSILEIDHGERFDGMLDYEDLRTLSHGLIQWPETYG
ncbi:MAG: hypothetical protein ABIT37_21075 [Luteolibacter sp.]